MTMAIEKQFKNRADLLKFLMGSDPILEVKVEGEPESTSLEILFATGYRLKCGEGWQLEIDSGSEPVGGWAVIRPRLA
jgi:hypothetical protein